MTTFATANLERMAAERGLVFADHVLAEVVAALGSGKHIMLTGPPCTGKTSLAYPVAELGREAWGRGPAAAPPGFPRKAVSRWPVQESMMVA